MENNRAIIKRNSKVNETTGCWLWSLKPNRDGYGKFGHKRKLAHRVSYEAFVGIIPSGKCILHRCDTRNCVNPDHLFIGTQQDNMADMYAKGRDNLSGLQRGQRTEILKQIAANMVRYKGMFLRKAKESP
jgi:HNH endonuclease